MKTCPKCKQEKPLTAFSADNNKKDGVRSWCRECCGKARKLYYLNNKEKLISATVKWRNDNPEKARLASKKIREELKRQVVSGYGGRCSCCGETSMAFLTIDHINGGGQKHRKLRYNSYGVYKEIIQRDFPDEFRVLCMNCNFAIRYGDKCPHETLQYKATQAKLLEALKAMIPYYEACAYSNQEEMILMDARQAIAEAEGQS